jgi:hypothetical protein
MHWFKPSEGKRAVMCALMGLVMAILTKRSTVNVIFVLFKSIWFGASIKILENQARPNATDLQYRSFDTGWHSWTRSPLSITT